MMRFIYVAIIATTIISLTFMFGGFLDSIGQEPIPLPDSSITTSTKGNTMITTNVHNVESVTIANIHKLEKTNAYIRDIKIVTNDGVFEITLFSNDPMDLEVQQ